MSNAQIIITVLTGVAYLIAFWTFTEKYSFPKAALYAVPVAWGFGFLLVAYVWYVGILVGG